MSPYKFAHSDRHEVDKTHPNYGKAQSPLTSFSAKLNWLAGLIAGNSGSIRWALKQAEDAIYDDLQQADAARLRLIGMEIEAWLKDGEMLCEAVKKLNKNKATKSKKRGKKDPGFVKKNQEEHKMKKTKE